MAGEALAAVLPSMQARFPADRTATATGTTGTTAGPSNDRDDRVDRTVTVIGPSEPYRPTPSAGAVSSWPSAAHRS